MAGASELSRRLLLMLPWPRLVRVSKSSPEVLTRRALPMLMREVRGWPSLCLRCAAGAGETGGSDGEKHTSADCNGCLTAGDACTPFRMVAFAGVPSAVLRKYPSSCLDRERGVVGIDVDRRKPTVFALEELTGLGERSARPRLRLRLVGVPKELFALLTPELSMLGGVPGAVLLDLRFAPLLVLLLFFSTERGHPRPPDNMALISRLLRRGSSGGSPLI
eukprot:scaffold1439_cov404-Prasinococcus_capsulatus_cf.AAC.41